MIRGKPHEDGIPINLIAWNVGDMIIADIGALYAKAYNEAVIVSFAEHPPLAYLEFDYNDEIINPLELTVELPLGEYSDEPVKWTFDLVPIALDILDDHTMPLTGMVEDEEGMDKCRRLSTALRALADQIDAKVKAP